MTTPSPPPQHSEPQETPTTTKPTVPILTHHCRFCNHLLLATTHTISTLPRRKDPSKDGALILPLPSPTDTTNPSSAETETQGEGDDANAKQKHYSILLSTAVPDRRATMVRRDDGFEKRWFLRCGRCRVVVGYFLDAVHFPQSTTEKEQDGEEDKERAKVVYLLPGALIETDDMGDAEKMKAIDREWSGWTPV